MFIWLKCLTVLCVLIFFFQGIRTTCLMNCLNKELKTKAKTIDKKNKLGYKISRPHLFDSSLCLIFWYSTTTRSWSWSISSFTNKQCVMLLFLYLLLLFICDLDKGICAIWTSLYPYLFFSSKSFKRVPKVVILQDGKNSIWKVWWFFQFGVL